MHSLAPMLLLPAELPLWADVGQQAALVPVQAVSAYPSGKHR